MEHVTCVTSYVNNSKLGGSGRWASSSLNSEDPPRVAQEIGDISAPGCPIDSCNSSTESLRQGLYNGIPPEAVRQKNFF